MIECNERGTDGGHDTWRGLQAERDRVDDDQHDDGALKPGVFRDRGEPATKRLRGVYGHGVGSPAGSKVFSVALPPAVSTSPAALGCSCCGSEFPRGALGERYGRFCRVTRTGGPQHAGEQVKRSDVDPGRAERRAGAEITLQLSGRGRMAEPCNGDMGHERAPLQCHARVPERLTHRPCEGDEIGLRRRAGPEHAGSAARWKAPETMQFDLQRRRRHVFQRGLDAPLRAAVDLADECEGQVQAIPGQPTGVSQTGLELANALFQRFRQVESDKQTWHVSFLRRAAGSTPPRGRIGCRRDRRTEFGIPDCDPMPSAKDSPGTVGNRLRGFAASGSDVSSCARTSGCEAAIPVPRPGSGTAVRRRWIR